MIIYENYLEFHQEKNLPPIEKVL